MHYTPRLNLILTVGLPRSGKSSWAACQNMPIVSPDAIRLAMHGRPFLAEAEPWVWLYAETMVKALNHAGHPYVIVDATHVTEKRRAFWREKFPEANIYYQPFLTPASICIERALKTKQEYLVPVINRMQLDWDFDPRDGKETGIGPYREDLWGNPL